MKRNRSDSKSRDRVLTSHSRRFYQLATAILLLGGLTASLVGCESVPRNMGLELEFEEAPRPLAQQAFPNWPGDPLVLEAVVPEALDTGSFKFIKGERTALGSSGAHQVELFFPKLQDALKFKWKEIPSGTLTAYNNDPRKVVAAYQLQKLFLDPEDYLVPTSIVHCAPIGAAIDPKVGSLSSGVRPSLPESSCVFGVLSVWLKNVTMSDQLYQERRFVSDPTYAYYMSNFNLFTYLADHRDAKPSNFLVSKDPHRRQVFSVDHDISFEPMVYNVFLTHWDHLFVPALRSESVKRLRALGRRDLRVLGVLDQFQKNSKGIYVSVKPGPNLEPEAGIRKRKDVVQFGLTRSELDRVWERIQAILLMVDKGDLLTFEG